MFSETSSFASSTAGSTRSSGGSGITTSSKQSRKRAKEQNKRKQRLTGKEGNPREEEYLVMTLKEMVPSAKYQRTITVHPDTHIAQLLTRVLSRECVSV